MPIDVPLYPVNLVVEGRRCLVIGGGRIALRKIEGLMECRAIVHVVAPAILEDIKAWSTSIEHSLSFATRPYVEGDLEGFQLVFAATDDPRTNEAVYLEGERRGIWVNSADDPRNCSFTLPSRVRQGPLLATYSTGGQSPAVAKWLRAKAEEELGVEYVTLIELLAAERSRILDGGGTTEGLDWQGALDSGMLDLIREGNLAEAKERLQACLSSSSD
jgi:precorrin-2 dehydrogenase/sirohydrochlorin ferrochelatase